MNAAVAGAQDPRIAAIRAYIDAGYTLIPLKGKRPTDDNWPATSPWAYDEKTLPGNYGIALHACDLVLDIDPRNFAKGDNPVSRLEADLGLPLSSYTVATGGGGLHVYFTKPEDFNVCSALRDYPGIEIKSAGRQVVGPGSIHPDSGKPYAIAQGAPSDVAAAPQKLLDLCRPVPAPFGELEEGIGEWVNDAGTQGRFVAWLQDQAPVTGSYAVALRGRDLGLAPAVTFQLMLDVWNVRRAVPRTPEELKAKVLHAYRYAKGAPGAQNAAVDFKPTADAVQKDPASLVTDAAKATKSAKTRAKELAWDMNGNGVPKKTFHNLLVHLRLPNGGLENLFGFNLFSGRAEFRAPAPWHHGRMPLNKCVEDSDYKMLKSHLATMCGFETTLGDIDAAVSVVAQDNTYHPVREFLASLKWDGKPRIDTWLTDFLGVEDSVYTRAVARKFLCAAVMRVMRPGVDFHHVLVLEGPQDLGKSRTAAILGGDWASDASLDPFNRAVDAVALMQGVWIQELAELEVTRRSDEETLKAFITRRKDKVRVAYGRLPQEFPRQSIFIGTKNPGPDGAYLKDDENRRWWPVRCHGLARFHGQADFAGLKEVRNQLFAEAFNMVQTREEPLYMETIELKAVARNAAALRRADHPWVEPIHAWLGAQKTPRDFVTSREIFLEALGGKDIDATRAKLLGVAAALKDLGWTNKVRWIDEKTVRGFEKADATLGDGLAEFE